MNPITKWISEFSGMAPALQGKLLASIIVVAALWSLTKIIKLILNRQKLSSQANYRWRKNIAYISYILGIILIGQVWVKEFQSLTTFLGLLAAGLAIALKDPIANLFGWAFIIWRKPFEVGDRIQIGEHAGDVIDVLPFQFVIVEIRNWVQADQLTGRSILIPNAKVFIQPVANFNHELDYIFHEIPVVVTFESDWKKAKGILLDILTVEATDSITKAEVGIQKLNKKYFIPDSKYTPEVYTSVVDHGIKLTMRYICPTRKRRTMEQSVWEGILDAFQQEPSIDFAYPTQRFYDNRTEGKAGMPPK